MLPEKLSTDLTSLNPDADRLAVVVEMTVDEGGAVHALVDLSRDRAQSCEACLQLGGRLARRPRAAAACACRGRRARRAIAPAATAWPSA